MILLLRLELPRFPRQSMLTKLMTAHSTDTLLVLPTIATTTIATYNHGRFSLAQFLSSGPISVQALNPPHSMRSRWQRYRTTTSLIAKYTWRPSMNMSGVMKTPFSRKNAHQSCRQRD
jgi:hypothetical protein